MAYLDMSADGIARPTWRNRLAWGVLWTLTIGGITCLWPGLAVSQSPVPQSWSRITPPLGFPAFVGATAEFDDGSGPSLYAAGRVGFADGMGTPTGPVARWNGTQWSGIGAPLQGVVKALAVFDDGSGPALYVGGDFVGTGALVGAQHLLRWTGTTWSAVPGVLSGGVSAIAVYDDSSGPALFIGGEFAQIDATTFGYVAKWNGATWSVLTSGVGPIVSPGSSGYSVSTLAVYDDGGGPGLCVGGRFLNAGGVLANNVAMWRGGQWEVLGTGLTGTIDQVTCLSVYAGWLYAGGWFDHAGGLVVNGIARWNGSWSAVGPGFTSPIVYPSGQATPYVASLKVFDDGSGPALFAGGRLGLVGSVDAHGICRWDGISWSALGSGVESDTGERAEVDTLAVAAFGGLPTLFVGGHFTMAGGAVRSSFAAWRGGSWMSVGAGLQVGLGEVPFVNDQITAREIVTPFGRHLLLAGNFFWIGTMPVRYAAYWNGVVWSPLDAGLSGIPSDFAALTVGGTTSLYAIVNSRLWRFVGTAWVPAGPPNDTVKKLAVFDPGTGPMLHALGHFTYSYGLARWTGTDWVFLGGQPWGFLDFTTLVTRDDGSGPALYAGGQAIVSYNQVSGFVWRWDGSSVTVLGTFPNCASPPPACWVNSIELADDGMGPSLFASGSFTASGLNHVARHVPGIGWQPVGGGLPGAAQLFVHDDGNGPRLHANVSDHGIFSWNGTAWVAIPNTPLGTGTVQTTYDDGGGRDIVLGGTMSLDGAPPALGLYVSRSCLDSHVREAAGVPVPVLAIGSQAGLNFTRSDFEPLNHPFSLEVLVSPPTSGPVDFVLLAMLGEPNPSTLTPTPVGELCMPAPGPGSPTLWLASSVGGASFLSVPPAPWTWPVAGIGFPLVVTLQGAMVDMTSPTSVSITNGIVLHVGP